MVEKRGCLSCRNLDDGAFCAVYGKRIPFLKFGANCVRFESGESWAAPIRPSKCKHCGEEEYPVVGDGKGPHAASLSCSSCGRHIAWMSKADFEFYHELVEALR